MKGLRRCSAMQLLLGGCVLSSLLLISCETADRIVVAPGVGVPGATYVGSQSCAQCHADKTAHFAGSTHARLKLAAGKAGTIINPRKSPEACFQCHLDKRGEMSLPHAHPVLTGQMSCVDCHDVHQGNAVRG